MRKRGLKRPRCHAVYNLEVIDRASVGGLEDRTGGCLESYKISWTRLVCLVINSVDRVSLQALPAEGTTVGCAYHESMGKKQDQDTQENMQ